LPVPINDITRLTSALESRYHVEREIGKGGMATVYVARDLRHDRHVALKLLDPELGVILGAERFLSEIRVTANLQHPNLLPLFDSGEADGLLYYVMPFVEGESLRQRLDRERQLPIDEALRIATLICGALDYAHRRGVIHRDLKPENILLNVDGQPLLADFGIALAVSNAGGARITQTGLSLGTPQYMSPEQATGDRAIDGRTDIYSLAAVTYEMLTGEPPHTAATAQGVLAKLMVEDPRPVTVLRRAVRPQVDAAIRHALEKLPADRFATAREFSDALNATGNGVALPPATTAGNSRWRTASLTLFGVATVCAVIAGVTSAKLARIGAPQSVQFTLDVPDGQQQVAHSGAPIAISPDGGTIAYSGTGPKSPLLYVRRLDELKTNAYPAGDGQSDLKFTPDGRSISFVTSDGGVQTVPVAGGPLALVVHSQNLQGTTWSPNGSLVYADSGSVWRVGAPGATPQRITGLAPNQHLDNVGLPFVFPNGKDVMFWLRDATGLRTAMAPVSGGNFVVVDAPVGNPLAYFDGWLVYGRNDGVIAARRFDQRARRFSGDAIVLLDGATWHDEGGLEAALSPTGTLVYIRGDPNVSLVTVNGRGVAEPLSVVGGYSSVAWSPDGGKLAIDTHPINSAGSIWVYDVASGALSRLTKPGTNAVRPAWTPDGKRIAFSSGGPTDTAIYSVPADLSGPEEVLYAEPGRSFRDVTFSPDGNYAVLRTDLALGATRGDIYVLPLRGAGNRKAMPLVQTAAQEEMPSVSPDSHWLAYQSDENGRPEIYVRPFPGAGGRVQVSAGGGTSPRWTRDGLHIVYRGARAFWSATLSVAAGTPQITHRDSLFADEYRHDDTDHQGFDIARDGRFAMFRSSGSADIVVVTNWWAAVQGKLRGK
jgi:eukaryotic-like serine/threonine-protein kinase